MDILTPLLLFFFNAERNFLLLTVTLPKRVINSKSSWICKIFLKKVLAWVSISRNQVPHTLIKLEFYFSEQNILLHNLINSQLDIFPSLVKSPKRFIKKKEKKRKHDRSYINYLLQSSCKTLNIK